MQTGFRKTLMIVFALLSLGSTAQFWFESKGMDKGREAITNVEERIIPAREAIPLRQGVIGYVGEWDVPGADYDYWDQMAEYMLAQYTLAPLILKQGAVAEWNVAVMRYDSLQAWLGANPGDYQIIPLEHGVFLLRRNKE